MHNVVAYSAQNARRTMAIFFKLDFKGEYMSIRKFFKDLNIPDKDYVVTADQIIFKNSLNLYGCTSLGSLPEGLTVGGSLYLGGCTKLTSLSEGLTVGGSLYLNGCTSLGSLPKDLNIKNIYVNGDQLKLIEFIKNSDKFKNKLKING